MVEGAPNRGGTTSRILETTPFHSVGVLFGSLQNLVPVRAFHGMKVGEKEVKRPFDGGRIDPGKRFASADRYCFQKDDEVVLGSKCRVHRVVIAVNVPLTVPKP